MAIGLVEKRGRPGIAPRVHALTAARRLTRNVVVTRRSTRLRQLTIRGFDAEVERQLRELARRERLSLNQAVIQLLARATGRTDLDHGIHRVGSSLDDLAGTWSARDEEEFARAVEPLERVDAASSEKPTRQRGQPR